MFTRSQQLIKYSINFKVQNTFQKTSKFIFSDTTEYAEKSIALHQFQVQRSPPDHHAPLTFIFMRPDKKAFKLDLAAINFDQSFGEL